MAMNKTETRKPVVVVDDVHVIYKVFPGGKRVGSRGTKGIKVNQKTKMREVHAVKGVTFTIYEGETVGIIGSNGSGKSSLMRVLAGITQATKGAVFASSRPTLLGVGAALMPNLSGEKNILLGGMALGFARKDMEKSLEAITEFAGLQEAIDLPMRTYSQGMSARLRFAIAAHRTHDILIIDEALAVGDKAFRLRSEARMREMRDDAGTVFLVSHSMKSIKDTCNRVLWLEKGDLRMDGDPETVIAAYEKYVEEQADE